MTFGADVRNRVESGLSALSDRYRAPSMIGGADDALVVDNSR